MTMSPPCKRNIPTDTLWNQLGTLSRALQFDHCEKLCGSRLGKRCIIDVIVQFNQIELVACPSNPLVQSLPGSRIIKRFPCLIYG